MAQWIYGKNAVMQILKSKKKVEKALVAEGMRFPEAETLLKSRLIEKPQNSNSAGQPQGVG